MYTPPNVISYFQETFVSCSTFRVGIRVVLNRVVFRVVVLLFVLRVSCCSFRAGVCRVFVFRATDRVDRFVLKHFRARNRVSRFVLGSCRVSFFVSCCGFLGLV